MIIKSASALLPDSSRRTIVIVGATSLMAIHCARLWLEGSPADVRLIGRNEERLQRVSADLVVRSPQSRIQCICTDLLDPKDIQHVIATICKDNLPSIVLIAHGVLPEQADCEGDLLASHRALEVNGLSPALWVEGFVKYMQEGGAARLVAIGSVAGDRGRQSNYVYGAAKGLLELYLQGVQHRLALAGSQLKVVLIKPGPTDTPMTAHLSAEGQTLAPVSDVARAIIAGTAAGRPVVYAPRKWRYIMLVIRHLPRFIFHRMKI